MFKKYVLSFIEVFHNFIFLVAILGFLLVLPIKWKLELCNAISIGIEMFNLGVSMVFKFFGWCFN